MPGYATVENFEDSQYLILIPDELADYGFLVEPLAICQHTLRTAIELRLLNHEPVAVVGLGVLGLLIAAELVDMGIEVVGYDIGGQHHGRRCFRAPLLKPNVPTSPHLPTREAGGGQHHGRRFAPALLPHASAISYLSTRESGMGWRRGHRFDPGQLSRAHAARSICCFPTTDPGG